MVNKKYTVNQTGVEVIADNSDCPCPTAIVVVVVVVVRIDSSVNKTDEEVMELKG